MCHPELCAIIPCKGRLAHLRETLPLTLRELGPADSAVVVDMSCPDACGDWAESLRDARVRVVRLVGFRYFQKTRALSAGLREALSLGARFSVAIDADMGLLEGARARLLDLLELEPPGFVIAQNFPDVGGHLVSGLLAAPTDELERADPWPLDFNGYGREDFFARVAVRMTGLVVRELELERLCALDHPDEWRDRHYSQSARYTNRRNRCVLAELLKRRYGVSLTRVPDWQRLTNHPACLHSVH